MNLEQNDHTLNHSSINNFNDSEIHLILIHPKTMSATFLLLCRELNRNFYSLCLLILLLYSRLTGQNANADAVDFKIRKCET